MTQSCDPVAVWLEASPSQVRGPAEEVRFAFHGVPVVIRSNSADVARHLRCQIADHYVDEHPAAGHSSPCRIEVHIIDSGRDRRIVLPVGKGASLASALKLPPPRATVSSGDLVHMRWDGNESFWRPFHLLVSLNHGEEGPRVQLLATGPVSAVDEPLACTGPSRGNRRPTRAGRNERRVLSKDEITNLVRTMLVRAQGHFCLHAATVAEGPRAILLMGPSGSGKTTTALALARGGYELLSDENSLLNSIEGGVQVAGFRSAPRVAGHGPTALADLESTLGRGNGHKTEVIVPHAGTRGWVLPSAIFFVRVLPEGGDHQVVALPPEEAFVRVTAQVLDPTNVFRREEQAQTVIRLVERCPAYELALGRRLSSLPDVVRRATERRA